MNESSVLLLLQLIKNNGSIESLINRGLEYSQIAKLISFIVDEGYASYESNDLHLLKSGVDKLLELNTKFKRTNSDSWISPQDEYKIEKKDKFDIYLPEKFNRKNPR